VLLTKRNGRVAPIAWLVVLSVGFLGLVPIVGSLYVHVLTDRDLYLVRVNVTDVIGRPIDEAVIRSSLGNHADKRAGAWQFEIPTQTRPADGRVTIYASTPDGAHGSAMVVLDRDYFPAVTIVVVDNEKR
jgi:hypothetical protein